MSDFMFMLENHLTAAQSRVITQVQTVAQQAGVNLFLTGGAVRDMFAGFPIRDLDFTVEGNAIKIVKTLAGEHPDLVVTSTDELRKSVELVFPGGITAEIGMARQERYAKTGGKPQVTPATIHEDLRGRDFTINALALSLNKASRGLLLDPTNGVSDLERREIRTASNYSLYDHPIRLFRLLRLQVRLGFEIAERTKSQYANAREAQAERHIPPKALLEELKQIASEPKLTELVEALDREKLLTLFSPALTGANLNLAGFAKVQKARQLVPFGTDFRVDEVALFLYMLAEKLSAKERAALADATEMDKETVDRWHKLEARAKKAEKDVSSAKLQKPSQIYHVLSQAPGEAVLFILTKSGQRMVQDRVRNYLQKHLPAAQEVTDAMVAETGVKPGTPKFDKARTAMISKRLDARPKKIVPEPVPEVVPPPPPSHGGRMTLPNSGRIAPPTVKRT